MPEGEYSQVMKFFLSAFLTTTALFAAGCGQSSPNHPGSATQPPTPAAPASSMAAPPASTVPTATTASAPTPAPAPQPTAASDTTASTQLALVQQDLQKTTRDLKDYTFAEKDAFVQKLQADQDELNKELATLSVEISHASDQVKADADSKLKALRTQTDALNIYLDEAKQATETTWNDVKADSVKAYDDARQSFQNARQWLSQQVSPSPSLSTSPNP